MIITIPIIRQWPSNRKERKNNKKKEKNQKIEEHRDFGGCANYQLSQIIFQNAFCDADPTHALVILGKETLGYLDAVQRVNKTW
jgi:hypothetical protein